MQDRSNAKRGGAYSGWKHTCMCKIGTTRVGEAQMHGRWRFNVGENQVGDETEHAGWGERMMEKYRHMRGRTRGREAQSSRMGTW